MLANFHQVSLVAPAANAMVLPLLPLIMVMGGGGALLAIGAGGLAWPALQLAGMIATWFRMVIEALGSLPLAAIVAPYFPARWLAAAAVVNGGVLAGIKLRQFFWQRRVWALLGAAGIIATALLLIQPDGRVHVYALDVGTGSAVLIRTPNGHQILIDAGPDTDKFAQAVGRALSPTARTIDVWLITGGRWQNIGAGPAVLNRFHIDEMLIADPDAWSVSLRSLVQQARAAGVRVVAANMPFSVDGVGLNLAGDGRSLIIDTRSGRLIVVAPETSLLSAPSGVDGAIFTGGGPAEWQGPGHGFSVIQVAGNSRDGMPVRSVVQALGGAPLYRTDRLGTIHLVDAPAGFAVVTGD
jgi:competence protein ComEC